MSETKPREIFTPELPAITQSINEHKQNVFLAVEILVAKESVTYTGSEKLFWIERKAYDKAVQALKFYAQETKPDTTSVFAKSALEFGEHCATWGPLTDLGERARATLKSLGEL